MSAGILSNGQPCGDEGMTCGQCEDCKAEARYWLADYRANGPAHFDARKDLGLPSDASDSEAMEAARRLK
jgi:hypothetical protein